MAARLEFTAAALADLDAIQQFIAQDSPASAERFIEDVLQRCRAIAETPLMGAPRPELGEGLRLSGVKRRVAILYKPDPEQTTIARVLYGGRDLLAAAAELAGEQ